MEPSLGFDGRLLPDLLDRAARARPEARAFCDGRRGWSWRQWQEEAGALAGGLQALGVRPGDVVAVHLPNCWQFLVAHVAVASAGAVMLPLAMGYGPLEMRSLLRRAGAVVLITGVDRASVAEELLSCVPSLRQVLIAGDLPGELAGETGLRSLESVLDERSAATAVPVRGEDGFLLLPSSGTTSKRPKLCLHSHSGLLGNAAAVAAEGGAGEGDSILSASPFTHLFGLLSVHLSLLTGGQQVLLAGWDPEGFLRLAAAEKPNVLFAVPAQIRDVLTRLRTARPDGHMTFREIRTGGAAVPPALVAEAERVLGTHVVVQWGMSELGAGLFTRPGDPQEALGRCVGRPVAGGEVRVVDVSGRVCGVGEVGQLQYQGPSLFTEYLGDPELTAAAFTEDGWLRTGDRAAIDEHRAVLFHGREAEILNVGGRKFSVLEVEELLDGLEAVDCAAVVGLPDDRLGQYPCLLAVPASGAVLTLDAVTAYLERAGLAEYKLPLELVLLPSLPRTTSGKIIRGGLAGLAQSQRQPVHAADQSLPQALELVRRLATGVLGRTPEESIGPGESFRDYGISSSKAVLLRNRLVEATGIALPSAVCYDHPTPAELARRLTAGDGTQNTPAAPETEHDPIVIVGLGLRLPGGIRTPEDFWQLLADGTDAISAFPDDRGWPVEELYDPEPGRPGKTATRHGGFLDCAAEFDPVFFGITPHEATAMDPQQRLLLETSWEALERAGIDPASLRESSTGVFTGMMPCDYAPRVHEVPHEYDGTLLTGSAAGVASGRVAYALGLRGPAITVDTACSSSLVALHLACQSLRQGECTLALVAGASVHCTPASFVGFSRQHLLAPDGRCKPFARAADGASWSEGVGTLVIERRSEALRRGHQVLAVVRGSALNQDGASNGLTAPSGPAQRQVIHQALRNAGLRAQDIDAVEAHGTGTELGDPIEAEALLATYGADRPAGRPLWLGSVKSNLGHTHAAAGVVSVIKMVLALGNGLLPRTLHIDEPSPRIDWSADGVRLLTEARPWPVCARVRRAGVSSFGLSGTNSHVILEEPPAAEPEQQRPKQHPAAGCTPWVLSAKSAGALRQIAAGLRSTVQEHSPADVAGALARIRSAQPHRAVVLAEHTAALTALAEGRESGHLVLGTASTPGGVVFVFPGQGSHWPQMADHLLKTSPVFADSMAACADAFAPHLDWSLLEAVRGGNDRLCLDRVEIVQPVVFAVMVSLAALWRSHGVLPDCVVGHSQGEIAAAHVAGALSLPDAARVVAVRSRLLRRFAGRGAMVSVPLPVDEVRQRLSRWGGGLSVAAANSPRSVVVTGPADEVDGLVAQLAAHGVTARRIPGDVAGHCPAMDEIHDELTALLAPVTPRPQAVPFHSTAVADWVETGQLGAAYWFRNVRQPVQFEASVRTLIQQGYRTFMEISPHPLLTLPVQQTADAVGQAVTTLGTLQRGEGDRFPRALAEAYVHGLPVDWGRITGSGRPSQVVLPTYPFARNRYWRDTPAVKSTPPQDQDTDQFSVEGLSEADAGRAVLALVTAQTASVCGIDEAEPGTRFTRLGFTSLMSVELRNRLARTTGLSLPSSLVLDHPTVRKLSLELTRRLRAPAPAPLSDDAEVLYRRAHASGKSETAVALIRTIAQLRATFDAPSRAQYLPGAVTLGQGPQHPSLLCFPSVTPLGAPGDYSGLGQACHGLRDVIALPQPGFLDGEPLPADLEALLALQVEAVQAHGDPGAAMVCGHSSGGWIAHAVAERLERDGTPVAGVVLIDTFWPEPGFTATQVPRVLGHLAEREARTGAESAGTTRLSATGGYLTLLDGWEPRPLSSATLHIRAEETAAAGPSSWELPNTPATVPGDHLTMLTSHSDLVAKAIEHWLTATRPAPEETS